MNRIPLRSAAVALLLVLGALMLLPNAAYAQASSGTLTGRVTDDTGAALPGVTITATDVNTGYNRVGVTEGDGVYRLGSLPVGTYTVSAELSGFAVTKVSGVRASVATERTLDFVLRTAAVQEEITVTADAPLVSTSPAIGTTVSQEELEGLPLNGRQFANLASLAPGTSLSVNADPTKPGQLTIALNGGSGRNVNFVIDGGDNTDDTIGGALQNFNLEAVQEFKIQTMQYKAEYGRSTGGVLSVVTKTGTNDFGGSVYGFFRDDALNAVTRSEENAGLDAQPYERQQWGGSFGGPIIRDRAHFFATYEKTDRTTNYTVDTGGIFPDLDNRAFPLPFEDELGTAKATVNLTPAQFLQVRYGYQKNADKYGAAPVYVPSALGTVSNDYKSILLGHTSQLGGSKLNDFVYQWTKFANSISADSNDPSLYFPSGVFSGQNFNTPQTTNQEKSQFKNDFSWSSTLLGDRHDFKTGFNYIHEPILGGDFTTGTSGQFAMLDDSPTSPVTSITQFGGFFGNSTPVDQYSIYLQDDWSITPQLTINAGIRYDYWAGFDLDQRSNPVYQVFAASNANLPFLADFKNGNGGVLENDSNNIGPRLGFSYDLKNDGRHILRGGYGTYYDFPYTNATILFPAAAVQSAYGVTYFHENPTGIRNPDGSFFQPGQALPANQLPNIDVPIPREIASPSIATPYSNQLSLGYSVQAASWLGLNFEAVSIDYKDIPYRHRANPIIDTNGDGIRDTRAFPTLAPTTRLWRGDGEASYEGFNAGFRARMTNTIEMQGFYTWSKAEGNVLVGADEFRLWDASIQPGVTRDTSVNPTDPQCDECFGPLYTDARHRVTLSALYKAPFAINLSGIFRYRSALPFTALAGSDLNGDGYDMDLAPGVDHVNSERGESFSALDVRLSREFGFGGDLSLELIGEVFNLLNEDNPAAFRGNVSLPTFGTPSRFAGDPGQGEQRLAQLGLRVRF